ncbi:MAG: CZB domain-containing protein [Chlorobiales bacterium]
MFSFKKWIKNIVSQNSNDHHVTTEELTESQQFEDPDAVEAAGLNFHLAILSHQKWKSRFKAMIDMGISEALNPDVIAKDDECVLGKWIHGTAKEKFGTHPYYEKLRKDHAFFHQCASRVLVMIIRGEKSQALQEIQSGDYARASNNVIMDLAWMYHFIKQLN